MFSPRSTFKDVVHWIAELGVRCLDSTTIESTARLSPDWGRLESKPTRPHR